MFSELSRKEKSAFTKALRPLGFLAFARDVWGAPTTNPEDLEPLLDAYNLSSKVVVMNANMPFLQSATPLHSMIAKAWDSDTLRKDYDRFNELITPILKKLKQSPKPKIEIEDAYFLRTFIVHEYRKLVLRDPDLPASLLPNDWPGHIANGLSARLYRLMLDASESFIDEQFINEEGRLPPPRTDFFNRFGGLHL
jgi:phenylacetic acid degradation operon negative regulatory protein